MPKKPEFNPVVTRIRLNPEQAVLACSCFSSKKADWRAGVTYTASSTVCVQNKKQRNACKQSARSSAASS